MPDGLVMKYFVLKPSGDNPYAQASRKAMKTYAKDIAINNPVMAEELIDWMAEEWQKVLDNRHGIDDQKYEDQQQQPSEGS